MGWVGVGGGYPYPGVGEFGASCGADEGVACCVGCGVVWVVVLALVVVAADCGEDVVVVDD